MTADEQRVRRIAIVGYGHWGVNHVRVFQSLAETKVVAVVDSDLDRLPALLPHIRKSRR